MHAEVFIRKARCFHIPPTSTYDERYEQIYVRKGIIYDILALLDCTCMSVYIGNSMIISWEMQGKNGAVTSSSASTPIRNVSL
jgi:hypothetical protein